MISITVLTMLADVATTDDAYETSGEFIDVLSRPAWNALRATVEAALAGASPQDGPLVDVGAGTGLGLQVLAGLAPTAELLAIEPSPVLRAVLTARVAADDDLRDRVTVVAADALGAELPDRLGAVVAMNMIGHLAPQHRRAFWRRVCERLAPGAPLVVNVQPPTEPTTIPYTPFGAVQIGRYTYEGGGSAEPAGPDAVTWRMRYRVAAADGTVVRESRIDYHWHVVSVPELVDELGEAGFLPEPGPLDVVRATRLA